MRKDWLWISLASALLAACTTSDQQAPVAQHQAVYNGPVVEIGGVEPRYEPVNPDTNQDYSVNGKTWHIVKDPANFSETGLASWYGEEANGNRTATGEQFDPEALTAAHPTLPLPSYVRVTNLANGRQIVVRVNDRGPFTPGRIIDLSRAAGDRLNISNNTRVKIDYISVAPDGTLSGPGTIGTTVAKQSYALPPRPEIGGGMTIMGGGAAAAGSAQPAQPAAEAVNIRPVENSSLSSEDNIGAPVRSSGFLGAPQPLPDGVIEGPETVVPVVAATAAPAVANSQPAAASGSFAVQVGALRDGARAKTLMQTLSKQFGVPGAVSHQGDVYRVQLGRFTSRQQASALQQRLTSEAGQSSFITAVAPDQM
ncbi:endolytic peptidoglycan transglycosylase RlpA [Pantoea sp. FN060301]|uniref:endolytic peptidoglycan transglycosylase RlpA n=1 Tax=Pantoea sp. FN060301 TaxID=3420380 RepID=UPI003D17CE70